MTAPGHGGNEKIYDFRFMIYLVCDVIQVEIKQAGCIVYVIRCKRFKTVLLVKRDGRCIGIDGDKVAIH